MSSEEAFDTIVIGGGHFVGLPFQTALSSSLLGGVGEGAKVIVSQVYNR